MSILAFYFDIVRALEEIDAPYMLIGAFAGSGLGISRATFDIDMVVDLEEPHFEALASRFPPPRYYADPEQMRSSTHWSMMFNIIDTTEGIKADLVPITGRLTYQEAFSHRVRRSFRDSQGVEFEAWCARLEDIIIGKLLAWQQGRSTKHTSDIREMLVFSISGFGEDDLDLAYVTARVARMEPESRALWRELLARAHEDVAGTR
jgi:hypothetical protein